MRQALTKISPLEFMQIWQPIRQSIQADTAKHLITLPVKRLVTGTKVARIVPKQYVETHGVPDRTKIKPFDNSQASYRYSGSSTLTYEPIKKLITDSGITFPGQSGTYAATKGKNGLYPTIAAERAFYLDRATNKAILSGDHSKLMEYFGIEQLMNGMFVLEHILKRPYNYVDLADKTTQDALFEIHADSIRELFYVYRDMGITDLPDVQKDLHAGFKFLLSSDIYDFTQPMGNALLEREMPIAFPSARASAAPVQEYFNGGSNIVFPNSAFSDLSYDGTFFAQTGNTLVRYTEDEETVIAKLKRQGTSKF